MVTVLAQYQITYFSSHSYKQNPIIIEGKIKISSIVKEKKVNVQYPMIYYSPIDVNIFWYYKQMWLRLKILYGQYEMGHLQKWFW